MKKRDHLRRLPVEHYRGNAIVHWNLTILNRKQGWLSAVFLYRFRELLTHTAFRYELACPIFCLMPDHFHMLWMGLSETCDQLLAMKHFCKTTNDSLGRLGYKLQDQAYDHVLQDEEKKEIALREVVEYIARNPERAGLIQPDEFASYKFSGCVVPGYPELRLFEPEFWGKFDRIITFLRKAGLTRHPKQIMPKPPTP
jgi:REP element-mobilizing transposase RayT